MLHRTYFVYLASKAAVVASRIGKNTQFVTAEETTTTSSSSLSSTSLSLSLEESTSTANFKNVSYSINNLRRTTEQSYIASRELNISHIEKDNNNNNKNNTCINNNKATNESRIDGSSQNAQELSSSTTTTTTNNNNNNNYNNKVENHLLRKSASAVTSSHNNTINNASNGNSHTPNSTPSSSSSSSYSSFSMNDNSNNKLNNKSPSLMKPPQKVSGGTPDIPHPYTVDGGRVPIYQMQYGIIYKRNWIYRNPEWCELCREPCNQWVQHIGRKDHCLMDMFYTAHVEWKRRWNPEQLLKHFYKELDLPLPSYHNVYTNYEREHHNKLYAMLVELNEAGMLSFDSPGETFLHRMQGGLRGMSAQGALVLHELILLPFMRLFPCAHIQDLSNLLDFVTCSYNLETVYDLCGLYTLDKVALREQYAATSPAALGLGGIATSSSATTGFARDATATWSQQHTVHSSNSNSNGGKYNNNNNSGYNRNNNLLNKNNGVGVSDPQVEMNRPISKAEAMRNRLKAKQQEDLDSEVLSHKGNFVRSILGQLRWLILPNQIHPANFTFPEHVIMLGEICLKTFVAEIAATRLCEYVTRCEVVWRNSGFERKRLNIREVIKDRGDVAPRPVRFAYKPMSSKLDDVYTTEHSALDREVREKLRRKKLPVLPEFEEDDKANTTTTANTNSNNNADKENTHKKLPSSSGQMRLYPLEN